MACGNRLETIKANGKGKTIELALFDAFENARGQGQSKCNIAGRCPGHERCVYLVDKITPIQIMPSEPDSGRNKLWFAAIETEGGCTCVDWDQVLRV